MIVAAIFASVALVSVVSFVGSFLISLREERLHRVLVFLIPLAIGALLGDAFFHLIPEAFGETAETVRASLFLTLGVVAFFVLEKYLRWHHHHSASALVHAEHSSHPSHLGPIILVSDGFHNFIDGIIIAASYLVGMEVGVASTVAIVLHEIPQEIGDFGVLIYAGYTRGKALFYNFLSALTAVLGAIAVLVFGAASQTLSQFAVPFAAGVFIYIASSDLVPELHRGDRSKTVITELVGIGLGLLAMYLLLLVE